MPTTLISLFGSVCVMIFMSSVSQTYGGCVNLGPGWMEAYQHSDLP